MYLTRSFFLLILLCQHHFKELLVVYKAIPILVDLAYQRIHLLVGHRLVLALQAESKFFGTDSARIVFVEILKGLPYLLLLRVVLRIHAGCDEFRIINDTIIIRVDH